jgi:hypothetical protein
VGMTVSMAHPYDDIVVTPVSRPLSLDLSGNLTVAPNTPSGTYIVYEICQGLQMHHSYSNGSCQ